MNESLRLVQEIWARLGTEGRAPTELNFASEALPIYSVEIDPWIERIAITYLHNLSRENAHSKIVIAPYGGGKTHFLMALGSRALKENFAVAYVACKDGVNLDKPLDVYRAFIKSLLLPNAIQPGMSQLLGRTIEQKRIQIKEAEASDPEAALEMWIQSVSREEFADLAFGRVIAEALRAQYDSMRAYAGDAALRWLRGELGTLTKDERETLRIAKPSAKEQNEMGRNLLLSVARFVREAGALGVVILFDEVETLFNMRGKALQRVLSAMRVMVDIPGRVPMLNIYAAVPDILDQLGKYPALQQRLAVQGVPFEEGNDFAAQVHLDRVTSQKELLRTLGSRLIDLAGIATGQTLNRGLQKTNVDRLAHVASESSLEIDARRLFIKACVAILNQQAHEGGREYSDEELRDRYRGSFENLKQQDMGDTEP